MRDKIIRNNPEYPDELIDYQMSQIEKFTKEEKEHLAKALDDQYDLHKEHYDKKLLLNKKEK